MLKGKKFFLLATTLALTVGLSSCSGGKPETTNTSSSEKPAASTPASKDSIKIGWFGPLTGPTAEDGNTNRNAAQLAVDQFNAAGGANGQMVELVAEDDQGKPEEALKAVQKLINNDKVVGIVSGAYSGPTKSVAPKVQEMKVPMMVSYSVHPALTTGGDYITRAIYTANIQGQAMAEYAFDKLQKKNIAVMYVDIDYGKTIFAGFKDEFVKLGGKIVDERPFKMGDKDFSSVLTSVKATNPEAMYIVGYYNEAAAIVKQAREAGIQAQFLGVDGFDSPKYLELGKTNTEGSTFTTSFFTTDDRPIVQNFITEFQAKNKDNLVGMMAAQGYDATLLMLNGLKTSGNDREKLKEAINQTKDFEGVTGMISIDAKHECVKPVIIMQVKDGKFVKLDTFTYSN